MPRGNANATELALEYILTQNQTSIRPVWHYQLSITIFIPVKKLKILKDFENFRKKNPKIFEKF